MCEADLPFDQTFEFEFRTTHCLWVSAALELKKNELSLRSDFWVPLIFFLAITKRGQYRLWTYLTSLLKRGRESLLKKSGEEWEDKGYFERKNWVERRSFYLILCTVQTQFFWVKQNSKIEFEFDFAQSLSALAASLIEIGINRLRTGDWMATLLAA